LRKIHLQKNYNKHFHRKHSFKDEVFSLNSNRVVIFILYQHRNFGIKYFYLILFYIKFRSIFVKKKDFDNSQPIQKDEDKISESVELLAGVLFKKWLNSKLLNDRDQEESVENTTGSHRSKRYRLLNNKKPFKKSKALLIH
jgi:hypothetical protein